MLITTSFSLFAYTQNSVRNKTTAYLQEWGSFISPRLIGRRAQQALYSSSASTLAAPHALLPLPSHFIHAQPGWWTLSGVRRARSRCCELRRAT